MDMLKNKWVLIGIAAVIVMIGVVAYFSMGSKGGQSADEEVAAEEEALKMKPEDVGLTLEAAPGNKEIILKIEDTSKFKSFEFELNYEADENGELVTKGSVGSGEVEDDGPIERSITIGTCSSGKCRYDTGVKKVSLVLRLNLKDGQTGLIESELALEEE